MKREVPRRSAQSLYKGVADKFRKKSEVTSTPPFPQVLGPDLNLREIRKKSSGFCSWTSYTKEVQIT